MTTKTSNTQALIYKTSKYLRARQNEGQEPKTSPEIRLGFEQELKFFSQSLETLDGLDDTDYDIAKDRPGILEVRIGDGGKQMLSPTPCGLELMVASSPSNWAARIDSKLAIESKRIPCEPHFGVRTTYQVNALNDTIRVERETYAPTPELKPEAARCEFVLDLKNEAFLID
jgi:hypothetical protein